MSEDPFAKHNDREFVPIGDETLKKEHDKEIADMRLSESLRHAADMRAIKLWQKKNPLAAPESWPDHADLVVWLLERIEKLETPTMYWPGDETMSHEDEYDLVEALSGEQLPDTTNDYEVMCGRSLPNRTIRVTVKHNMDYAWEWVDA